MKTPSMNSEKHINIFEMMNALNNFADRHHLNDWGRSITGDSNIDMEAGFDEVEDACLQEYSNLHLLPERDMTPDELYDAIAKETDYINVIAYSSQCTAKASHTMTNLKYGESL